MKVYMAMLVSCDGNRLGRVWSMQACYSRDKAEDVLQKIMDKDEKSTSRQDSWKAWVPDVVDGKRGMARWHTGLLTYIEELEVQ